MSPLWSAFALLALSISAEAADLRYTITVNPPDAGIRVALRIADAPGPSVTVAMPVWIPGYYRRLDLQQYVKNVSVTRAGLPVDVTRPTPSTWRFDNVAGKPITFAYDIPEYDAGFANSGEQTLGQMGFHVDGQSAFVQCGAALVYVDGLKEMPARVALEMPAGWQVATPLRRDADGTLLAPDYDTLNDSPIQMGAFRKATFSARGKDFEIITTGASGVSEQALLDVVRPIATAGIDLFDGWAPFDRYQFHFHFPPKRRWSGPGLEHRESCVIVFEGEANDRSFRERAWNIITHEYLHAWNVKAIRPEGLGPFDYQAETRTPSLWFSEGVTDYYATLLGVRSGLIKPEAALERLNRHVSAYNASPGRDTTSLADASSRVWENGSSSGAGGTNYYTKGALAGLLLDCRIRAATSGRRSLDDVMRWMVHEYAARDRGFTPDAPLKGIREATGVDVSSLYHVAVNSAKALPLEAVLRSVGIAVRTTVEPGPVLGVEFDPIDAEPVVRRVTPKSAAADARIKVGDVLVTVNGEPATAQTLRRLPGGPQRRVGDVVKVEVRRGDKRHNLRVTVKGRTELRIEEDRAMDGARRRLFEGLWRSDRLTAVGR